MKVLISDKMSDEGIQFLEEQGCFDVANRPGLPPDELLLEVRDAAALIVRSKTKVTPAVFEAASQLKAVGRAGAGVDNIDLEAATRRGVVVMNTPGGNSVSAGEHAFALLMALARKIPFAHSSMKSGLWNKAAFMGKELHGKTLGLLGIGKIGSVVAQRGVGFRMRVLAYDPFVSESYAEDLGVELCSMEDLLPQSDFISLHLPANEKTKQLVNKDMIDQMKDGAILVNAARGALIEESDLVAALKEGKLAGAALDVFENEPNVNEELRDLDNVVLTPHIAGSTQEAQAKVGHGIAVQISNYLKDNLIVNAVNFPSISSQEQSSLDPYIKLGEKLGSFLGQISEIRISEIGLRYYGDLAQMNYKPLSNYILKAILTPILSEDINQVSARKLAIDRGISVIETTSTRERSYSNLISVQLRSETETEWVEGAILHHGNLRLISVDGIPAETQLGDNIVFIRNADKPGVIGKLGTTLGESDINIGSFVLGRSPSHAHAVGVINTDTPVPDDVLGKIAQIPAVQFARVISLGN
jgi:D-3-phosphoglycerate dehydrogenase